MSLFTIPQIPEFENADLKNKIQARLDDLTKPQGSLGKLEEYALKYCLCRNSVNVKLRKLHLVTVAGDHGITAQNITPYPPEVTKQMVMNMINGGAAVSVLCKNAGIGYSVIDAGVAAELPEHPLLVRNKIAGGTADFSAGPAMTSEQCSAALQGGVRIAVESEADLLGIGEMGIGNSASAAALYALLLDCDAAETTGAGTGACGELLAHKKAVVTKAVALHREQWDRTPLDALCRCGGFEIAMMIGIILGAASTRVPVVIDGFISGAAALCALRLAPAVRNFLYFSHVSAELFHSTFCKREHIEPLFDFNMRLGEGTGSVLGMQIISQAINCYSEMATFSSASVSKDNR